MNDIPKIDKNIPIRIMTFVKKYPFDEMEVGDSFFSTSRRMRGAAFSYGKNHNKKFCVRVEGEGLRCWRIK